MIRIYNAIPKPIIKREDHINNITIVDVVLNSTSFLPIVKKIKFSYKNKNKNRLISDELEKTYLQFLTSIVCSWRRLPSFYCWQYICTCLNHRMKYCVYEVFDYYPQNLLWCYFCLLAIFGIPEIKNKYITLGELVVIIITHI